MFVFETRRLLRSATDFNLHLYIFRGKCNISGETKKENIESERNDESWLVYEEKFTSEISSISVYNAQSISIGNHVKL